jgi:hypothetical protein
VPAELRPGSFAANVVHRHLRDAENRGDFSVRQRRCSDESKIGAREFRRFRSANVLGSRNRFKVRRANARALRAEVVYVEAVWDRADLLLVHHAMGELVSTLELHTAVAGSSIGRSLPDPAGRLVAAVDLCPEIGSQSVSAHQVSNVTPDEAHRLACDVPVPPIRHRRDRGFATTTALAEFLHSLSISAGGCS